MKHAILGASGQVGQEFAKVLPAESLITLTHDDVDVGDEDSVQRCLDGLSCDVIVNLAAFHDVNGCEEDPAKAFRVNTVGAGNVARAAARKRCRVVYLSSDYVFGLERNRNAPYLEGDAIGPLSVYGVSKAAGEQLVQAATDNCLSVRTSSLFGVVRSRKGWTFPEMILQRARKGEPLKVVDDQYMSPTYTLDLVRTVVSLCEKGVTGLVHVTNGDGCTWYEFAVATLKLAGIDYEIEAVGSDAFPSKAQRPVYSRLDSERIESAGVEPPRHWRDALQAYLIEKGVIG